MLYGGVDQGHFTFSFIRENTVSFSNNSIGCASGYLISFTLSGNRHAAIKLENLLIFSYQLKKKTSQCPIPFLKEQVQWHSSPKNSWLCGMTTVLALLLGLSLFYFYSISHDKKLPGLKISGVQYIRITKNSVPVSWLRIYMAFWLNYKTRNR